MHSTSTRHVAPPRQRGFAALAVTLLLFFAMSLVAAYASRGLWIEQRASAHQYRAAQAFEAAEAGLEWAAAQLNRPQRIDDRCQPSTEPTGTSFRERFLDTDLVSGQAEVRAWTSGSTLRPLQPGCVRTPGGWSCSCPANGLPSLEAADDSEGTPHPAFLVQFTAELQPGLVRVTATGCTSAAGPCRPGTAGSADASVRLQVVLGLLPGLTVLPQAPLTVKGDVDVGAAPLGLHNTDAAAGGVTLRAGGSLNGSALRLGTAPGGAAGTSAVTHDTALAGIDNERLHATYFGVDKAAWKSHAAVQSIACDGDCAAPLAAAIERTTGNRMVSVAGDARIDGPVSLGSAARPVVIVVDGRLTLRGAVTLHGLIYATDIRWDDTAGSRPQVRGALVSEAGYAGNATPDVHRDTAVLRALQTQTGSYVRVPGSWRDF